MGSEKGIVINISGSGEGAAEALRMIEAKMQESAEKGHEYGEKIAESWERVKGALELAGVGMGLHEALDTMREMVTSSMELGVSIGHLSEQTGISAENISVLRYAARQTGIDVDVLTKGFKKFSTVIDESQHGSSAAVAAFSRLKISGKDLAETSDDMYKTMELVAERFEKMRDGAEKNALAQRLFGRAGQELIPILNQGAAGIENFRSEAESLGIVMDKDTIEKLEQMHQSVDRAKQSWAGFSLEISSDVAPALTKLFNLLLGKNDDVLQAERAAQLMKTLPEDLAGDNAGKITDSSSAQKSSLEKSLVNLEQSHQKKLISEEAYRQKREKITRAWDQADLRENQAYFSALQDQITNAQVQLNKDKAAKMQVGTSSDVQKFFADKKQLDDLLATENQTMDRVEAARKRISESTRSSQETGSDDGSGKHGQSSDLTVDVPWSETASAWRMAQIHEIMAIEKQNKLEADQAAAEAQRSQQESDDRMRAVEMFAEMYKKPKVTLENPQGDDGDLGPIKQQSEVLASAAQESAHVVTGFMDQMAEGAMRGKINFKNLVDSVIMDLTRWALKVEEEQSILPLMKSLFGVSSGVNFNSAGYATNSSGQQYAGMFAGGGDINDGWAIVGDGGDGSGSEIFAPKGPGTVLPHDVLESLAANRGGGGAPNVTINTINNSSSPVQQNSAGLSWDGQAKQFVIHTVLEDMNTGGPVSAALSGFARS